MRRLPHVTFSNLYGPTETTIASSYYTLPACPASETQAVPIGTACEGEELLILDEALRPVGDGEVGHLHIRGVGLSPGYWNDPERTREVFLADTQGARPSDRIYRTGDLARRGEDGLDYFGGRGDTQGKGHRHRIERGGVQGAPGNLGALRE